MSREEHLVSVVIPTYNRKEPLVKAIESCFRQDYADIEIVVCDDHSNDGTEEIVLGYVNKDERVKYYKVAEGRKGANEARNTGIINSNGEYIVFLDSDDLLTETSITSRLQVFKKHDDVEMVYGDASGENGRKIEFEIIQKYKDPKKYMLCEMALCPFSVMMVRKDVFRDIPLLDNELLAWQDDGLVLSLVMNGKKIYHSEQIVAEMYTGIGEANISSNFYKKYQGCKLLVDKYEKEIKGISYFRYLLWKMRILRDLFKAKSQKNNNFFVSKMYNVFFEIFHILLSPFFKKIWG